MPLVKSKSEKAFKKNIATEVKAGKPVKQAVAIAYSTKRAAKKAGGGRMSSDPRDYDSDVDFYAAQNRNEFNAKYPTVSKPSRRQSQQELASDPMNPSERRLRAEQARLAKQKPMNKKESMDFLKAFAEGLQKSFPKKAKGGKVKKYCGEGW